MKRDRTHQSGFTLLEMVATLAILAATVALGVELSKQVLNSGNGILRVQQGWTAEQFIRSQLAELDGAATVRTGYLRAEPERLTFISRRSAQHGPGGPSFVVSYRISGANEISYFEMMLPPQWTNDIRHRPNLDRLLEIGGASSWSGRLLADVNGGSFRYLSPDRMRWIDRWQDTQSIPAAVRITARTSTGPLDLLIETRDSYFSLFSGS